MRIKLNFARTPHNEKIRTFVGHNCIATHRTHRALAKCRWPRSMSVEGDGPFGVYMSGCHRYGGSGKRAVWPDICLFDDYDEACEFYADAVETNKHDIPRHKQEIYMFQFPDDPGDADEYQDRTLAGIRQRHRA